MSSRKRVLLCVGIVMLLCLGTVAAVGCGSHEESASPESTASASTRYAEQFPLQYETLQQTRVNAKGITVGHAAEHLAEICEAPTVRDANGDPVLDQDGSVQMVEAAFNPETDTYDINRLSDEQLAEMNLRSDCVACKTTHFDDIYAQQGAAAFGNVYNAEARAIVGGDYFDCALCHVGEPDSGELKANLSFWQATGGSFAARLDPRIGICAQCHNYSDYRSSIETEDDLRSIDMYRNGYDIDALFETSWEDGVNFDVDEKTGIAESYVLHPTVELFKDTRMEELGVTCVDCHMPKAKAEDGAEYTDHFSAKSPLESDDSLAYCLTCHERQGTKTADDMAAYTRERQRELAEGMADLQKRESAFKAALVEAVGERGKDDPSLDEPKELYAKATWYDKCLETGPNESPGSQAAMLDWRSILEKAQAACDEGMAALGR